MRMSARLKKGQLLREGYIKGLRKAQRIINEALYQSQGFDDDNDEIGGTASGKRYAVYSNNFDDEFRKAVKNGDTRRVETLLDKGANANTSDEFWGDTLLHIAAFNGHLEICKLLLEHGADVNAKDESSGSTPLHDAA